MKPMFIRITTAALVLAASTASAIPQKLITHNTTDVDSNAYVAGAVPSRYPTKAHSDGKVSWTEVKLACFGHIVNGRCPALIKMETNTDHPIELGYVSLDMNTGDITPKYLSAYGYTMTVNGPGETTLSKN